VPEATPDMMRTAVMSTPGRPQSLRLRWRQDQHGLSQQGPRQEWRRLRDPDHLPWRKRHDQTGAIGPSSSL
jgi:hypothetical protein